MELFIYIRVTTLGVKFVRYTSRAVDFEHSETAFCTGCKCKVSQLVDVFILYQRDSTVLQNQLKLPDLFIYTVLLYSM